MLPFLFEGTRFETPTYFVLYLLGFLGGIMLATRRAKDYGLPPVRAVDFGMFIFILGVAGARLAHILIEAPDYYWEKPIRVFYFWQGGFVLYGGLILATSLMLWIIPKFGQSAWRWGDVAAPSVLLGIGIGRMGCLAGGCCHGVPTDWWWGMIFSASRSGAPLGVALHPTQLLEALFGFVMAGVFWIAYKKPPKREGEAYIMAALVYAIFRIFMEFLRGDADRGVFLEGHLSTSQIISLIVMVACMGWLYLPKIVRRL